MGVVVRDMRSVGRRPKAVQATEPSTEDLIEYAEQVDRGNKVAFPMLFDGIGADPEPPLDADEIQTLGGDLQDMRTAGMAAAKVINRPSSRHLHARLMAVVDEIDRMQSDLVGLSGDSAA